MTNYQELLRIADSLRTKYKGSTAEVERLRKELELAEEYSDLLFDSLIEAEEDLYQMQEEMKNGQS